MPYAECLATGLTLAGSMSALSICINTQTPLVQFMDPMTDGPRGRSSEEPVHLTSLQEGTDYRYTPGGVTRMVYPLVRRLLRREVLNSAHWVALNPHGPRTVRLDGLTLHNVSIEGERMAGYGKVKEAIWGRIHDLDSPRVHDDLFWTEAFSEYAYYNRITSELIQRLDEKLDFDAFYVHDFQQLPVGHMLGTLKPRIFRWHIPFEESLIPEKWRSLFSTYLNSYDVIVVSARRYAESLASFRPKGKVLRIYPYVDPADYGHPEPSEVAAASQRWGLRPDDDVALIVARMDPVKGQDLVDRLLGMFGLCSPEPHGELG